MGTRVVARLSNFDRKIPVLPPAGRNVFPGRKSRRGYPHDIGPVACESIHAVEHESARDGDAVRLVPMVKRIAMKMRAHLPAHIELDELVGAGVLGLLDAVRKFDPRKHVKMENYARHRIRGAILDGLRVLDSASRDMRKKDKRAERAYRKLEAEFGRAATDEEIAHSLGLSLGKWYVAVRELQAVGVDWLRPMTFTATKQPVEEMPAPENQENQFELCYRREQRELLRQGLALLAERDRTLIVLYYAQGLTMKQIGVRLNIDESRVSQLHSAALARLRLSINTFLRRTHTISPSLRALADDVPARPETFRLPA